MTAAPLAVRLPIYIVDDDAAEMTSYLRTLRRVMPGSSIDLISTLEEAEEVLLGQQEPFLLVMDQNFGNSPVDGARKGTDLVALLRRQHVWGGVLPVLLLTGNFDDEKNTRLGQQLGWRTPTTWVHKSTVSSPNLDLSHAAHLGVDFDAMPSYLSPGNKYLIGMLVHLDKLFAEQLSTLTSQRAALETEAAPDSGLEWESDEPDGVDGER